MPQIKPSSEQSRYHIFGAGLFIALLSFFTYFYNFSYPNASFWDEPYHIASAQKYLHGVFFMEQHPPLGKLLIALGETLMNDNVKTDQFLDTDYARDFSTDFSFAGYRLFPTLFGWLTAVVLYAIFFLLTRNYKISTLLSFLYVFDNAQIVHSRGAMVDSTLIFFALVSIFAFLVLIKQKSKPKILGLILFSSILGASFAAALTTKVVALVLILLYGALIIAFAKERRKLVFCLGFSFLSFILVYVGVWMAHFSLEKSVNFSLENNGYYQASEPYKELIRSGKTNQLRHFPLMLAESLAFVAHYNNGVPRLNLCKADENGSPFYLWPFGGRTINYRWNKPGDGTTQYLYLQSNPVTWGVGLVGVLLAFALIASSVLTEQKRPTKHLFFLCVFFILYAGYMGAISQLDRVMYLYHYFLPLNLSYILFALGFDSLRVIGSYKLTEERKIFILTILGICTFISFQFFRPLSYYQPLTDKSFMRRSLLKVWELSCVNCTKESSIVVPVSTEK